MGTALLDGAWTTKRLTYNSGDSGGVSIATNGANIYAVWVDSTPGNPEIYFRKSADNGSTWQSAKRLTNNDVDSSAPHVAASGSTVYVVWSEETSGKTNTDIFFRRSLDNGSTWQSALQLTDNTGQSENPAIAASGANVYVAWEGIISGNEEIYFRMSADSGSTWNSSKRMTNNTGFSRVPSIAASGANVGAVWFDSTPGNAEIYFRRSADNGSTWQTSKRLTNNSGSSCRPAIAAGGSNIYVAWYDSTPGNPEIYFRRSADSGSTWLIPYRLTNNAENDWNADISINNSNVFVAWTEHISSEGDGEIFLKYSPL